MTYENLARTFDILASKNPTGTVMDWAEHDEYGFELSNVELSAEEVRTLISMGWGLGSDSEYDEEEMDPWNNQHKHTDEEIMELWNNYKAIYTYA